MMKMLSKVCQALFSLENVAKESFFFHYNFSVEILISIKILALYKSFDPKLSNNVVKELK